MSRFVERGWALYISLCDELVPKRGGVSGFSQVPQEIDQEFLRHHLKKSAPDIREWATKRLMLWMLGRGGDE